MIFWRPLAIVTGAPGPLDTPSPPHKSSVSGCSTCGALYVWLAANCAGAYHASFRRGSTRLIGRINHIAIAVPDVMAAARQWETILGAKVSAPQTLPEHGVSIVFVIAPNGKVELMEPFGEASPIASFLARNENGGIHHICLEVDNIQKIKEKIETNGVNILGNGKVKIGAHGKPVLFLDPSDISGTLLELEEK
mgnify:CR=1 FL=1